MRKLFLLVSSGGDGSYAIRYTFNEEWINAQEVAYSNDELDCEYDIGVDGDGFHYDTVLVPNECTLESLGIHSDCSMY